MSDVDKLFAKVVVHRSAIEGEDNNHYPHSEEKLSIDSAFAKHFGLMRLGIYHELMPPGRRLSWPHAEADEEEFVYVIEGEPDLWLDGHVRRLKPGDGVGFPAGTGIAHTFINNTDTDIQLLVVGEASRSRSRIYYPKHPVRNVEIGERLWKDAPLHELGSHDGLPDQLRKKP